MILNVPLVPLFLLTGANSTVKSQMRYNQVRTPSPVVNTKVTMSAAILIHLQQLSTLLGARGALSVGGERTIIVDSFRQWSRTVRTDTT